MDLHHPRVHNTGMRFLLALVLTTASYASTVHLVGSDPSHAIDFTVSGVTFHDIAAPTATGTPFDYAVASSRIDVSVPGDGADQLLVKLDGWHLGDAAGWLSLNPYISGTWMSAINSTPGQDVRFAIRQTDGQIFYSDPALNADGQSHATHMPEPATISLIGGALLALGFWKRRKN